MNFTIYSAELENMVKEIKVLPVLKANYNRADDAMYLNFAANKISVMRKRTHHSRENFQSWTIGKIDNNDFPETLCFCTADIFEVLSGFASSDNREINCSVDYDNIIVFDNKIRIKGQIAHNPRTIPEFKNEQWIKIPCDMFKAVIDFASDENYRIALEGIHVHTRDNNLIVEGCDAHRAGIKKMPLSELEYIWIKEPDFIIQKEVITAILKSKSDSVQVFYDERYVRCGGITSEMIHQDYPNIAMIIPSKCDQKLEIELKALEKAVKNLKGKTNKLNDAVEVSAEGLTGLFSREPIAGFAASWNPVHLKRSYLAELVKAVKFLTGNHTIIFERTDKNNSVKVSLKDNNSYTGVLCKIIV